jgi:hypothetical protein
VFDAVDALEILGCDADLAGVPAVNLEAMLPGAGLEQALRSALLEGDARALRMLLRAPRNVCCLINPAEEEDDEDEEQGEESEDDGDDAEDDAGSGKASELPRQ